MLQGCTQNMSRPVLWYLHDMKAVRAEACFSQSTAVRTSLIMQLTSDVARLHRPRHARRWFQPATLPDCGSSCSTGVSSGRDFSLSVHIGTASLNRSESSDTASRRCLGQHLITFWLPNTAVAMFSTAGRPNVCDPWPRESCR